MRSPNRRHDLPLLHKYTSASTAAAILRTATLRWSSPLLFNDPFDVPREMQLPFSAEELKQATAARIQEYLDGTAQPAPSTPFAPLGALAKGDEADRKLMADIVEDSLPLLSIPYEQAIEQSRAAWDEKVKILRIVCFSAVCDSPTMWAHYANDHAGVVLQFESDDERDSSFLIATQVIYQPDPPSLPPVDQWVRSFLSEEEIDWSEYFREYRYVKSEEWSSEQEYRAISASLGDSELYSDNPFLREDLRGIVLGSSIQPDDEEAIRALAREYPRAVVYRASLDHQNRRVAHVRADSE